jgi:hypothetical protein
MKTINNNHLLTHLFFIEVSIQILIFVSVAILPRHIFHFIESCLPFKRN